MKKLFLFLCLVALALSCRKEYNVNGEVDDGCNGTLYSYSGTPTPGKPSDAYGLLDYAKVEAIVRPIKDGNMMPNTLGATIASKFESPFEKAYALYYWIDINISYDYARSDDCKDQNSYQVLTRKKGVCEGFANLFAAMCMSAGIHVVKIWGYTHAWNAIEIHGKWYLVDVTWDVEKKTKSHNYFLADPQSFYLQHDPEDLKWKLF